MKTTITAIAAVSVLVFAPHLAMAESQNGQLSQDQVDAYCLKAGANSAAGTQGDTTATGKIDCSAAKGAALSASNGGAEDNGTETESGADSDADAED